MTPEARLTFTLLLVAIIVIFATCLHIVEKQLLREIDACHDRIDTLKRAQKVTEPEPDGPDTQPLTAQPADTDELPAEYATLHNPPQFHGATRSGLGRRTYKGGHRA